MAVTTTNLGVITAYGDAVAAGYTGTKAEWQTLMASYATVGQQAVDAKDDAVAAKNIAVQKATDASTAAGTATQKANEASASAQSIAQSASQIAQNTSDISELKEDFTQMESDGVVPSAEQILSDKGVTDNVPYHYRKTGGDGADRLYDQIVGGTVNFNQQIENGNFGNGSTGWGITNTSTQINSVESGVLSMTCSVANSGISTNTSYLKDHKYLKTVDVKSTAIVRYDVDGAFVKMSSGSGNWETLASVFDFSYNSNTFRLYIRLTSNATVFGEVQVRNAMLIDLTAMFGSTIADYIYSLENSHTGDGVAFFKALFPNDYYPYNAGELVSVSGLSEHKMVGFNQWDEEWEIGGIVNADGQPFATNDRIRSKNFCKCVPSTTYYCCYVGKSYLVIYWYDSDKNYISYENISNTTRTSPQNAGYFKLVTTDDTTYKNDICTNISDPAKNGTYEPYKAHSYPLDDSLTLRGLFKLDANNKLYADGDTYDADGTVTRRYGVVDLGSLNWTRYQFNSQYAFYVDVTGRKSQSPNSVCGTYTITSDGPQTMSDKTLNTIANSSYIYIRDDSYTDVTAFKTAMSGVMLVYELATPTTEEADPYQHLQQCDPNGTEEYVSTGIVPIGHNSFYPENLRAKVEQLPWNFASIIAPTESTFTATRNYTTGSLFIVDNVLYKATSNIANGGAITPNTNCTATTLAEIISALA